MWKESYRIGVESIDRQHIELFKMVEDLHKAISEKADSNQFRRAVEFLKNYVVRHFSEEEAYQASVHYSGFEAHKLIHRKFTDTVLDYEKRLEESDYNIRLVKDLAGMLTAWLVYHVAEADQQIVKGEFIAKAQGQKLSAALFSNSLQNVLEKLAGSFSLDIKAETADSGCVHGDILVLADVFGDKEGSTVFGYSYELAASLLHSMTFIKPGQIDEVMCSALAEITNIACGNVLLSLSKAGVNCRTTPPRVDLSLEQADVTEGIVIHTGIGSMELGVKIG